jgi:X-Pro dipeptidyl-peptidase
VSGRPAGVCDKVLSDLSTQSAEQTGDYNGFWQERDYRQSVANVRASVFAVHGLNDTNVTTSQFAAWWKGLAAHGVPRKVWLSLPGHVDPFDVRRPEWVDTLHRWFDFWLQGIANGIDREPKATLETSPGVWSNQADWPAAGSRSVSLALGNGDGTTGTLGRTSAPAGTIRTYHDVAMTEAASAADPNTAKAGRLAFLSAPLTAPLRISGSGSVRLRVKVDRPTTELTARLVDYGTANRVDWTTNQGIQTLSTESCFGASTRADDACYRNTTEVTTTADHAVLTRGWQDAAHYSSLSVLTPLRPDTWYTVTVPLEAYDTTLAAGHVLGLILVQSDPDNTISDDPVGHPLPTDQQATVQVDLSQSALNLPTVGPGAITDVAAAPHVTTKTGAGSPDATSRTGHMLP